MDRLAPELRADPSLLAHVATVAASVLRRHGEDPDAVARTDGWVNPGWMSERFVVRVGLVPGQTDLRREAKVAAALPAAVGYPQVVDAGVLAGHEYLLTRRIPGTSLLHAWPAMSWEERSEAIKQMWALAEHVHAIDLSDFYGADLSSSPFYAASLEDAVESLEALRTARLLSRDQIDNLIAQLHDFFESAPSEPSVLNHGDLYIGNAMWDGTDVVGLLDFEFAVVAPVEVDLNEIVKYAFAPADTIGDDMSMASRPLRQAVVDIATHRPVRPAMLKGYSILLELWLTNREIGRRRFEDIRARQSYRLLTALAEREGGYLAPLLSR